ncbi:MAG: ferritin [bacterium]|nr:ferritin [bacterium]
MIKKKMEKAINKQINWELYSSYFYLSMSAYFEFINLSGFANWMKVQAREELEHAMKMFNYLVEQRNRVILSGIFSPPSDWKSPLDVFEDTYRHEKKVTGLINKLVELAGMEKDSETKAFLQWFVKEQVEEEENASKIVKRLKLIGNSKSKLAVFDKELSRRK